MTTAIASPFKSEAARSRYLERYALRASAWPVPSKEREIATSFGITFVRESGPPDGPPLLMLPGIGSPGLSFVGSIEGLSGPLRSFAIDNIHDNGRSVESKLVTSADDFTTWLDEVRAGLGFDTVNLLGLSYGGWISTHYALRFPDRVRRLVLLAPAGTTAPIPFGFIWRALLCFLPPRRYFMRNFMAWMSVEGDQSAESRQRLDELVDDATLALSSFRARKMVAPLPLSDEQWKSLTTKTLYLAGDHEVNFPPHEAVAKLRALAPHVEAELYEGSGHDFFVTRASEVTARVLRFLLPA